jgi:hypothetical protein
MDRLHARELARNPRFRERVRETERRLAAGELDGTGLTAEEFAERYFPVAESGSSDDAVADLIERGPLGTPLARGLRALARDADIEAVFRRLGYRLPADRERE